MRIPWWACWLTIGPLSRPGTEKDLAAIEWIISRSTNPNSQPVGWWAAQIESAEMQNEEDLALIALWIMASYLSHNSLLMFKTAQVEELTNIEWTFTAPVGDVMQAALNGHLLPLRSTPGALLVGGFWRHALAMAGPETRWIWRWRRPARAV